MVHLSKKIEEHVRSLRGRESNDHQKYNTEYQWLRNNGCVLSVDLLAVTRLRSCITANQRETGDRYRSSSERRTRTQALFFLMITYSDAYKPLTSTPNISHIRYSLSSCRLRNRMAGKEMNDRERDEAEDFSKELLQCSRAGHQRVRKNAVYRGTILLQ